LKVSNIVKEQESNDWRFARRSKRPLWQIQIRRRVQRCKLLLFSKDFFGFNKSFKKIQFQVCVVFRQQTSEPERGQGDLLDGEKDQIERQMVHSEQEQALRMDRLP
jgi:hypothetical protein